MADKEFKTISEQIAILESRGLCIPDITAAKEFLYNNNYYRVSGYSLTLRRDNCFYEGTTFQNIIDIYSFDRELRSIILCNIEIIEVRVKSIYAYEFAKVHGPTGYRNSEYFTDVKKHSETLERVETQKASRHRHEAYLKHFIDDLHQDVPLWAYIDLFTIHDISVMYSISEQSVKDSVSRAMGLYRANKDILAAFMKSMTIIRNLCARGSRIYNRLFEQKPSLNKDERRTLIKLSDGSLDNSHFYGFILIMRRLLETKDFAEMKADIITLCEKYPFVDMKYYGFRNDWRDVL